MPKIINKNVLLIVICCILTIVLTFLLIRTTPIYWEKEAGTTRIPITFPDGTIVTEMTTYSYTPRDFFLTKHQKQVDTSLELDLDNVALSFSEENGYIVPEYELISANPKSVRYKIFAKESNAFWEVWVVFDNGGANYAVYKGGITQ